MKRWIVIALAAVSGAGCVTRHGVEAAREARAAYEAFIGQRRDYEAVVLRGDNMAISISGATEIALRGQLTPLAAMPRENDTPARIADAVKNSVLGAVGLMAVKEIATQPATVVQQPPPMVVRPEVVTVP